MKIFKGKQFDKAVHGERREIDPPETDRKLSLEEIGKREIKDADGVDVKIVVIPFWEEQRPL